MMKFTNETPIEDINAAMPPGCTVFIIAGIPVADWPMVQAKMYTDGKLITRHAIREAQRRLHHIFLDRIYDADLPDIGNPGLTWMSEWGMSKDILPHGVEK